MRYLYELAPIKYNASINGIVIRVMYVNNQLLNCIYLVHISFNTLHHCALKRPGIYSVFCIKPSDNPGNIILIGSHVTWGNIWKMELILKYQLRLCRVMYILPLKWGYEFLLAARKCGPWYHKTPQYEFYMAHNFITLSTADFSSIRRYFLTYILELRTSLHVWIKYKLFCLVQNVITIRFFKLSSDSN